MWDALWRTSENTVTSLTPKAALALSPRPATRLSEHRTKQSSWANVGQLTGHWRVETELSMVDVDY